jgi:hypothetical protein
MNAPRWLIALTIVNLALLALQFGRIRAAEAAPEGGQRGRVAPVLRGSALEIVDEQGRVRASIKVQPAEPSHPETVMLRLIDANGRPEVKLGASEQGGGLGLIGAADATHVVLQAHGAESSLKLTTADGRHQLIKP